MHSQPSNFKSLFTYFLTTSAGAITLAFGYAVLNSAANSDHSVLRLRGGTGRRTQKQVMHSIGLDDVPRKPSQPGSENGVTAPTLQAQVHQA